MSGHDGWLSFLKGTSDVFNFTYRGSESPAVTVPATAPSIPPAPSSVPGAAPTKTVVVPVKSNIVPRLNIARRLRGGKRKTERLHRKQRKQRKRTNKNK
jgi:hypothetical protein